MARHHCFLLLPTVHSTPACLVPGISHHGSDPGVLQYSRVALLLETRQGYHLHAVAAAAML